MIDKTRLKKALDSVMQKAGFLRVGPIWYFAGSDATIAVLLQKSDHGDYFYLRCGIHLKALADDARPKVNKCHIQFDMDALVPEESEALTRGLDLKLSTEETLEKMIMLITKRCLSVLLELASLPTLRAYYRSGLFQQALLFWQVRELLEDRS